MNTIEVLRTLRGAYALNSSPKKWGENFEAIRTIAELDACIRTLEQQEKEFLYPTEAGFW